MLSLSANEIDEQQLVTRQQSRKITQTVGSVIELDSVSYHQASAKIFNVCSKASILIAETECNDVYFVSMPRQQENELLKLLVGAIKKAGLLRQFSIQQTVTQLQRLAAKLPLLIVSEPSILSR